MKPADMLYFPSTARTLNSLNSNFHWRYRKAIRSEWFQA